MNGPLERTACEVHGSDLRLRVAGKIRYPDAFVTCTDGPDAGTVVEDPVVVFEILSPSTERTDRIANNQDYAATPSVRRCVMLEQGEAAAVVFERAGSDWIGHVFGADAILHMPEIGVELPMADLYRGLRFD